jgi:predicted dehydrogenase
MYLKSASHKFMNRIKIGVLGAGHLGKIHIRLLKEIPLFEVIGFYDISDRAAALIEAEFGIPLFPSADALIEAADAIDIVTPTLFHFDDSVKVLRAQKHLFVEKPVTNTMDEARALLELAREASVRVQVGHVERFNPAFLAARNMELKPMFMETHRLAEFNPRGTDVPVVLDLMIHDIDIMLHIVQSNVKHISASGVAVVSHSADIANARIEFDNGCVANLTASRISMKSMRKTRLFQRDAYIAMDFLNKSLEVFQLHELTDEPGPLDMVIDLGYDLPSKKISFNAPKIEPVNAIKMELELFAEAILNNTPTPVTLEDGVNALNIAYQILEKVDKNMQS